jgi:hypothetical protein
MTHEEWKGLARDFHRLEMGASTVESLDVFRGLEKICEEQAARTPVVSSEVLAAVKVLLDIAAPRQHHKTTNKWVSRHYQKLADLTGWKRDESADLPF